MAITTQAAALVLLDTGKYIMWKPKARKTKVYIWKKGDSSTTQEVFISVFRGLLNKGAILMVPEAMQPKNKLAVVYMSLAGFRKV